MDYDQIYENISKGKYETDCPYPAHPHGSEEHKAKVKHYREECAKAEGRFMADVKAYLDAEGVPTNAIDKVYSKAWQDGHSSGYNEVLIHASDLADLFKP